MIIQLFFCAMLILVYTLLLREFGVRLAIRPPFVALGEPKRFGARIVESLAKNSIRKKTTLKDMFVYREGDPVKPSDRRRSQIMIVGGIAVVAAVNLLNALAEQV